MTGTAPRPLVFGEALYDCFDDGATVLGGAPFNVAWHLQGFGLEPLFISRVGEDALGERLLEAMARWGMDTSGVQRDGAHGTGRVEVHMSGTDHRFEILPDQAYDHIDPAAARAAAGDPARWALLYHGSLAVRADTSAAALAALRAAAIPAFVDVNLRAPWWQCETVDRLLQGARWVKLNDEELDDLQCVGAGSGTLNQRACDFLAHYGLDSLVLTRGAEGALLLRGGQLLEGRPPRLASVADTVGAGDAFAAVTILGLLQDWPAADILGRALAFAARICQQQGATAEDPALYRQCLAEWGRDGP